MICVFDCETIPDSDLIRQTFDVSGDDLSVSRAALAQYQERSNTTFLPHPYHKVVAISAVIADEFGTFTRVNSIEGESEEEIVGKFLAFIDKHNPRLVSFNGRSFDIPLLMLRALKYNLSCPAYFEQDNAMVNKSKWDNYRTRYSETFHLDLLDSLSHYGAVRGMNLDTLCQMAGIPGKFDVSGDQVMELYYQGQMEKIREYCESDVINTYLLFLKYELLKGMKTLPEYKQALEVMQERLPKEKGYSEVFANYLQREIHGRS